LWSVAIISNGLFSNHDRKPAYLDDRYGALRQVEKLQAQARGATVAPPASTAGHKLPRAHVLKRAGIAQKLAELAQRLTPDQDRGVVLSDDVDREPAFLARAQHGKEVASECRGGFDRFLLIDLLVVLRRPALHKGSQRAGERQAFGQRGRGRNEDR
jgi:hypothetical protein